MHFLSSLGTDILVAAMLTGTSELNLFVFHVWQGAGEILGDILEAMSQAGPAVRNSAAAIETSTLNYFFFFFVHQLLTTCTFRSCAGQRRGGEPGGPAAAVRGAVPEAVAVVLLAGGYPLSALLPWVDSAFSSA